MSARGDSPRVDYIERRKVPKDTGDANVDNKPNILEYNVIKYIAGNKGKFNEFVQEVSGNIKNEKEAAKKKIIENIMLDGKRKKSYTTAICGQALKVLYTAASELKEMERRHGNKIPAREAVIKTLCQHENSVLSAAVRSSFDSFQKRLNERLFVEKKYRVDFTYEEKFDVTKLPDLRSVRDVLTSAFQSVPEVPYTNIPKEDLTHFTRKLYWWLYHSEERYKGQMPYPYDRVVKKLQVRGLYTIDALKSIKNQLHEASLEESDLETKATFGKWKEHLTHTIYDQMLHDNQQKHG